jgi:hypothetical protein
MVSFKASAAGQKNIVEYLLSKDADVNVKDFLEWSPLHYGE